MAGEGTALALATIGATPEAVTFGIGITGTVGCMTGLMAVRATVIDGWVEKAHVRAGKIWFEVACVCGEGLNRNGRFRCVCERDCIVRACRLVISHFLLQLPRRDRPIVCWLARLPH